MQIKFLTIYGSPIHGSSVAEAQSDLLKFWQQSIINSQVMPISNATVSFNDYSFSEYYNQEKLYTEICRSVLSGYNHELKNKYWRWAGRQYYNIEELYNDLAEEHRLMELVIDVK
jgi:hypothetical protein